MESVVELLVDLVFSYPGAGIRWLWHRGKIPYKKLLEDDIDYNSFYVILLNAVLLVIGSI